VPFPTSKPRAPLESLGKARRCAGFDVGVGEGCAVWALTTKTIKRDIENRIAQRQKGRAYVSSLPHLLVWPWLRLFIRFVPVRSSREYTYLNRLAFHFDLPQRS
jgi:hypothetical protein